MNSIENVLLDLGLSWTISKLLPYLIAIVLGIVLVYVFRIKIKSCTPIVKWSLRIGLIVLPFVAYFIYAPIYEGDFSNGAEKRAMDTKYAELTGEKLVIIALPNCPFCLEAMERLKKLKKRVPSAALEYVLCNADSSNIGWYKENAGNGINVRLATDSKAMSQLAEGKFPTFVLVGESNLKIWPNNSFGVLAMDELEKLLQ